MREYHTHTLPNGLRIIHMPMDGNVAYCGFIVNAGTRDESEDEFGMAHFVEHMLFKGTQKRRSYHIINRMEHVGGELNAYTNKEETVLYSICLSPHFERAVELMSDMILNSSFPQYEIDKEIDVIIDEIHSYEDSPAELIFDDFENLVFRNSQLGHNILGEEELLKKFDTTKASLFKDHFYNPSNMVFFSLGSIDFKKVVRYVQKYVSETSTLLEKRSRLIPPLIHSEKKIINQETSQVHALIGGRAYSRYEPKRKILHLLNNILGGPGMNSRLNISLREKKGYVYNVDSSITTYSDCGIFSIYFGCDKRNQQRCVDLVHKELKKLRTDKLSTLQLDIAKRQIIGQIGIMNDNRENKVLAMGKSYLHHNHFNSLEETFKEIEAITALQIQDVANEILNEKQLFSIIYN